ncbi:Peptidase M20 domain-containing protein 2 OS=Tsukamurella paurometabola (strain ATCC 8368 / DSM/ CCUG 35730 / CIP 100753 / JCM 10117 / KCTC 9821 / NBRC 16120 / NCIMB 702349 / NCTC 13040) OX=521096 GN=Tpau_0985 PE=3 SV=1 [Tsukamurella paurometabola]|uniref:Peptidase M20 domain-containing protein 2 n=1 Tax=Tsukamurella paurometabola (strain ATCC 8368 / DSM 20162 / CCUG 35730 / CIP 100753 / JCM 10117 / KCTC 9821 / NBRC 16120 / NCIMB 702349 / NCTC 13040) TaxID=521096 RepID=D5UUP7_TSUPD|nr:amidohydrolase [Tsukamurella paurometabola DSM 20162]SUP27957.1 Aminobenzoyl-glutamate utilization protein B [Tsukamurella paurometabola]
MPVPVASTLARLTETVDAAAPELVALSHAVHARPELAFEEHYASGLVAEALAGHGFAVTRGIADLETALVARSGTGPLRVAVFAEYDALPGIGHACGHNIIAAAGVGAGLALASVADDMGLTVEVYGTPAEESGAGKVLMLRRGAFDAVACAGMVHPAPFDVVRTRTLALADLAISFTGREAHASAAPWAGRNAGDAATVAQVALGLLRQHLEPGQQLHGFVSEGGTAPNVVPAATELLYYLRAETAESLDRLAERANDCFAAGALASGCTHEVREVSPSYSELRSDEALAQAYRSAAVAIGREPVAPEYERAVPLGSTDMGNVSHAVPSIHPLIGLDTGGAVTHQPEFTAAAASASADRAVRDGALALAAAFAAVAENETERARLLDGAARRGRNNGE